MKAKEVMRLLHISRATLYNYRKLHWIKCTHTSNSQYDYDLESILNLLNQGKPRLTYIYVCNSVDGYTQMQISKMVKENERSCTQRGIRVDAIVVDRKKVLHERKQLWKLIQFVLAYRIKMVIVPLRQMLGIYFPFMHQLFALMDTRLVTAEELLNF